MRTMSFAAALLAIGATTLPAQSPRTLELRPMAGATIPTGAQRDLFKDAPLIGFGVAMQVHPNLHLVGSFGWMREHTRYAVTQNDANRYQYDAGVELSLERPLGAAWTVRPFFGLGAGARTYNFQAQTLATRTCAAGYGALGSEFRLGATALRLEARDNVFCYKSPIIGQDSHTRNDLTFSFGAAYHLW